MDVKKYKVTCLSCLKSSLLNIVANSQVNYIDHTPIIACRMRGDMKWGFECICGNDSRLARQEQDQASTLLCGSNKSVIKKVVDSLKIKDELKFKMESA